MEYQYIECFQGVVGRTLAHCKQGFFFGLRFFEVRLLKKVFGT